MEPKIVGSEGSSTECINNPPPAWRFEFEAAGYKPYNNAFISESEATMPPSHRLYVGSSQRKVFDDRGIRYFISVNFYEFLDNRWAAAVVQFHAADNMRGQCVNVELPIRSSVLQIETCIADLWQRMGWGYFEVENSDVLRPTS